MGGDGGGKVDWGKGSLLSKILSSEPWDRERKEKFVEIIKKGGGVDKRGKKERRRGTT